MARPHNLQTRYTAEQRETALALAVTLGSQTMAAEQLKIPLSTLAGWMRDNEDRLAQLRKDELPAMQARVAKAVEDLAIRSFEKASAATELFNPFEIDQKDLPKAAQSMTTSGAILLDKAQMLRGLPTHIVQKQDANQLVEQLARLTGQTIEGTAEEIKPPAVLAIGSETKS